MATTAEAVYSIVLSTVVLAIIAWVKAIGKQGVATRNGVRCLLYVEIKKLYYQVKDMQYCPLYILEDAEDLYKEYKSLKGNGAITSIIEEMRKMPKTKFKEDEKP